jgi:hypothetical protein
MGRVAADGATSGKAPTVTPPKYRVGLERSGYPKDARGIMAEASKFGVAACAWRSPFRFEN